MTRTADRPVLLIVDDEPANIRILSRVLMDMCEIAAATNGAEALETATANPPDIILLDIMLPGMDGHEVCRRLKADPATRNVPVIFLTGKEGEADELAGLRMGAVDYIIKPFSTAIVKARVKTQLELKRYRDLLENQALVDALTGIPNRRRLEEYLDVAWRQSLRTAEPLSALMFDVDHFKAYNDHYGHQAGDECLRAVARALEDARRRGTDLVARYGGEEFVAILPSARGDSLLEVAESYRAAVEALGIPHPRSAAGACVTVSVGAATILPEDGFEPAELVRRADIALYRAKETGRNRVVMEPGEAL